MPAPMGDEGAQAIASEKGQEQEGQQGDLVECHWRSPRLERTGEAALLLRVGNDSGLHSPDAASGANMALTPAMTAGV